MPSSKSVIDFETTTLIETEPSYGDNFAYFELYSDPTSTAFMQTVSHSLGAGTN